jgi:SAM-dependent methyltransferase
MRELIPWWGRICAKLVLSRLPAGYATWRGLNLFRHGAMHRVGYALEVFRRHFAHLESIPQRGFVALEIGPGDSLFSGMIAAAHGAMHTYLIDAGPFATTNLRVYQSASQELRNRGIDAPSLDGVNDIAEVLRACHASYATQGLSSMREVPSASVDFMWSQAVLEHVRKREFLDTMRECRRILKSGGICSHQIDLRDHLGGALNNLRFSERVWESEIVARSGFYTNRISFGEMLRLFGQAGFVVEVGDVRRWPSLPTPRKRLAREFGAVSDEDLLVSDFGVLLR